MAAISAETTDEELVQITIVRGAKDDRPYQELMRRHQQMVWNVCFSFTRNAKDAEDLAQEVFFKAYRNLNGFEGRSKFKTWLYRIAVNTGQNEVRRRRRRPQSAETEMEVFAAILPSHQNVEGAVQEKEQQELLRQALAALPQNAYEALHLKDIEERPYVEISEMLDISVSAAKMRVQRARLALRSAYLTLEGR